MNKMKKSTFMNRIRNAWRALRGKPASSITLGVEVKRCSECERCEPREGKWVEGDYGETLKLACSACGSPFEYRTTFCPDCGAKMKGGE